MPVYEFFCRKCQEPFTENMSIKEHDERTPKCPRNHEAKEVEKRISSVHTVTTKKSLTY
ncbi:zinc ribbon domain-containing protein [Corallococcus praedator]|uniref:Zinc ribbon domain-containing protein n=1 Tax=Corallococcus praedator TaxID=2316724 RepID=A0ABX9QSK1_9BACT|nr:MULTISPECIES: FmdB family zinc ribbon protein [Corallococcus]RKH21623.1 zinc ribbon domain-containing protein [Corallococcus sp. CA047B]RKH35466.1 zinc ribbon domain-containing protein [Corallococcus sp. CA031C]RKI17213.1 zinc ribbon domain-containing protein [Corallococcus praedator]